MFKVLFLGNAFMLIIALISAFHEKFKTKA